MVTTPPLVIFRIDDMQDYWIRDVQQAVANVTVSRNKKAVGGFIMHYFGQDTINVNFFKNLVSGGKIELGIHGYDHINYAGYPFLNQLWDFQRANNLAYGVFGYKSRLFLPPYDLWNADTLTALQTDNYAIMSTNSNQEPAGSGSYYPAKDSNGLWHIPYTRQLNHWDDTLKTYVWNASATTFSGIQADIAARGWCVVATHGQEFAMYVNGSATNTPDTTKITSYGQLVDQCIAAGYTIGGFSDLIGQDIKVPANIIVGP